MITPIDITAITFSEVENMLPWRERIVERENEKYDKTILFDVFKQWKKEIDFSLKEFVALQKLMIWNKTKRIENGHIEKEYCQDLKQIKTEILSLEKQLNKNKQGKKFNQKFIETKNKLFRLDAKLKNKKLNILNELVGNYRISII